MPQTDYKQGQYVMYRANGIFRVDSITKETFRNETKEYYVLRSVVNEHMVIHVPIHSETLLSRMRPILTKAQILEIIDASEDLSEVFPPDGKERSEKFQMILHEGDSARILWLVKVLSLYQFKQENEKKKFYASDEKVLTEAKRMITEEFSFVLNIEKDDVIPYILEHIGAEAYTKER